MNRRKSKKISFTGRVKVRIGLLRVSLILMLVYMIVIGELGLGDSRYMTQLAETVSRIIFFGGLLFVIYNIIRNKKLMCNKALLLEQQKRRLDERQKFLYDKSGGIIVDILLIVLLFVTCTTAFCNMPAFYISLTILIITIILKIGSYLICDKIY